MHHIFIWNPKFGHIGHVSMRVNEDLYISLWPKEDHNVIQYIFDVTSPSEGKTYEEDCELEGDERDDEVIPRPPDREIELQHSLDEEKVASWWSHAQHGGYSKSMNCITAVQTALKVGCLEANECKRLIDELEECYIYFSSQVLASKGGKKRPSQGESNKHANQKRTQRSNAGYTIEAGDLFPVG